MEKQDINQIIMVGGSIRLPSVQDLVSKYFDNRIKPDIPERPEESVAHGAAYLAFIHANPSDPSIS